MQEEIKTQVELIKDLSEEISAAENKTDNSVKEEAKPAAEQSSETASMIDEEITAEVKREKKPFAQWPVFGWFLNSRSIGTLILKCLLLFPVIPYAYLFILSAIFSSLNVYEAVGFILYSSIAFSVINIGLAVWAIARFVKSRRA